MAGSANTVVARFAASRSAGGDATALGGVWFEAKSSAGTLRLYTSGIARHAADAAVVLAGRDTLLDALDDWTRSALDWRWLASPSAVTAQASHARVHWRPAGADSSTRREPVCRIELPWLLLRALPAPDEALARCLRWPDVAAALVISQPHVPAEDLARLEPGGAFLLPESMSTTWSGVLRAMDEPSDTGVPVALPSPWAPRRVATAARNAVGRVADGQVACEVRLALAHAVPGDRLAGWFEGDVGQAGPRAGLWCRAAGREPARCLASGPLLPWGDGWALAVQNIHDVSDSG